MTPDRDLQARQYLLGALSDDQMAWFEQEYFEASDALERVEAAEERLIEDYLDDAMSAEERRRFEAHYLPSPPHRARVETIRRLKYAAQPRPRFWRIPAGRFALAAAVLLTMIGVAWVVERGRNTALSPSAPKTAENTPVARRVFAISISSITVRGASDSPAIVIPPGTDAVDLRLEGDGTNPPVVSGRAVIRTVSGQETWQGPVEATPSLPSGVISRVEVPAARLTRDDYIVTLLSTGAAGDSSEIARYFLRVR